MQWYHIYDSISDINEIWSIFRPPGEHLTDFTLNNGAREMGLRSFDGGEDDKHNHVGFVDVSKISTTTDGFDDGAITFDGE